MQIKKIVGLIFFITLSGCASLNSVSVTSLPANRDNQIQAQADKWIIFGLSFDNDYADTVAKGLEAKCPRGKVSGILTKDEAYYYFLALVVKRQIQATGYCETKNGVAMSHKAEKNGRKVNSAEDGPGSEDGVSE